MVTKGFRTLEQDREQPDGSSAWQLDQPEEDEVSLCSFTGLSKEEDLPWLASTPAHAHAHARPRTMNNGVCVRQSGHDNEDDSLLETLSGVQEGGAFRGEKEGPSLDGLPTTSCSSLSGMATPSADEPVDFRELQAGAADGLPGEGVPYVGVFVAS